MDDFTSPSFTLSVFWVSPVGIPKTLGIWVPGYPKHGNTQITVTPKGVLLVDQEVRSLRRVLQVVHLGACSNRTIQSFIRRDQSHHLTALRQGFVSEMFLQRQAG